MANINLTTQQLKTKEDTIIEGTFSIGSWKFDAKYDITTKLLTLIIDFMFWHKTITIQL